MILVSRAMSGPAPHPEEEPIDARLLRRWSVARDRDALAELVERLLPTGWRVARCGCASDDEAADVLQDAVALLMAKAHRHRAGTPVLPWFVAIVANAARSRNRAERRRREREATYARDATVQSATDDRTEAALAELARLPERERLCVWLNAVEGVTCRDIAASLGVPEGTIRSRVSRGLARLRQSLGATALSSFAIGTPPPGLAARLATTTPAAAAGSASLVALVLAIAATVAAAASAAWLVARPSPDATVAAASTDPIADAADVLDDRIDDLLAAPVVVRLHRDRLRDAMILIADALPPRRRLGFVAPARLAEPWSGATVIADGVPLRRVFDDLSTQLGLRWQVVRGTVVFSATAPAADVRRWLAVWDDAAAGSPAWTPVAASMVASGDVVLLRRVLLAIDPADARSSVACEALGTAMTFPSAGQFLAGGMAAGLSSAPREPSLLLAFADDAEVLGALRLLRAAGQGDRRLVACLAGQLRDAAAVPDLLTMSARAATASKAPPGARSEFDIRSLDYAQEPAAMHAIDALGAIRDRRAVVPLIRLHAETVWPLARERIAQALARIGDPRCLSRLDPREQGGRDTIMLLGAVQGPEATARLVALLDDPAHRGQATKALVERRDPEAIPPLLEVVQRRDPVDLRSVPGGRAPMAEACAALARLGPLCPPEATQALLALVVGMPDDPLRASVQANGLGGDHGLFQAWAHALDALAAIGDPAAIPAMAERQGLSYKWSEALLRMRRPEATEAVIAYLERTPWSRADQGVWNHMATSRDPRIADFAAERLAQGADPQTMGCCLSALVAARDDRAVAMATALAVDADAHRRRSGLRALGGTLGGAGILAAAIRGDTDAACRSVAVQAAVRQWLDGIRDAAIADAVLAAIEDAAGSVRATVVRETASADSLRPTSVRIRQLLRVDPDPQVRQAAAQRLRAIDPAERDALIAGLDDPDQAVAEACLRELEHLLATLPEAAQRKAAEHQRRREAGSRAVPGDPAPTAPAASSGPAAAGNEF